MKHYIMYETATGKILQSGAMEQELAATLDSSRAWLWLDGPLSTFDVYVSDGQLVPMGLKPSEEHLFDYTTKQWVLDTELVSTAYKKYRQRSYPAVGDQLDSLWHAMDQNVFPKVEPFYSQIKAVKDTYPKPV